jgi:hemolysin D
VPDGRSKLIQPLETAVVRAIHVRDGQSVKSGEVLIELDPTATQAELGRVSGDLMTERLNIARYRAALSGLEGAQDRFVPPTDATPELVEMHREFLNSQVSEQEAKIAEIDGQLAQKQAERDTISGTIDKLSETIPLLQQRVDTHKYLYDRQLTSKITYLTELQDLVGQRHDLDINKVRYREADAVLAALRDTRKKAIAEFRRTLFDQLAKSEQKEASLVQELIKAERVANLKQLVSPVDGVVQQLAIHTVGGVVTPAQALAVVVPAESGLEIETMVANRDIGFVVPGQEARIKVDTFNFTRYGLLHGRILSISRDSITQEVAVPASAGTNRDSRSTETKMPESSYSARVSLEQTQLPVDGRLVDLAAGMAVTVEIKTGSRRIISYLLSPIARYRQEVLRER